MVPLPRLLSVAAAMFTLPDEPIFSMPLLFQVLVFNWPALKVVVPNVLSAPLPLMLPPFQLKAPATSSAPSAVRV